MIQKTLYQLNNMGIVGDVKTLNAEPSIGKVNSAEQSVKNDDAQQ